MKVVVIDAPRPILTRAVDNHSAGEPVRQVSERPLAGAVRIINSQRYQAATVLNDTRGNFEAIDERIGLEIYNPDGGSLHNNPIIWELQHASIDEPQAVAFVDARTVNVHDARRIARVLRLYEQKKRKANENQSRRVRLSAHYLEWGQCLGSEICRKFVYSTYVEAVCLVIRVRVEQRLRILIVEVDEGKRNRNSNISARCADEHSILMMRNTERYRMCEIVGGTGRQTAKSQASPSKRLRKLAAL